MTTTTLALADFLLAQIAEDEAVARLVAAQMQEAVDVGHYKRIPATDPTVLRPIEASEGYDGFPTLIAAPARVLAECEAKRNLVNYATFMLKAWADRPGGAYPDMTRRERSTANVILEQLAAAYADHPDYCEEWRP